MMDEEDRERLEADISLEEIQLAIGNLQAGKIPGSDDLPAEFYPNFIEIVALKLKSLFADLSSLDALPESMEEAVIVLIPKPGKDARDCASYRPISLLNVDERSWQKC